MDDDYTGHLLEQILDEVKAVHELVAAQPTMSDFRRLEGDVAEVKGDVKTAKAAEGDQIELRHQSGYARPGRATKRTV